VMAFRCKVLLGWCETLGECSIEQGVQVVWLLAV
jgi:hypothetical protein